MAKAIKSAITNDHPSSVVPTLRSLSMLRLMSGLTILLGSIITALGTAWDIQWHGFVGRDRTLVPPHLMMLGGIFLSGVAALIPILIESYWTRRNPQLAKHSTSFAGLFNSSLGMYIAGFAALNAAIAFPLDSYWHALYGIDVSLWAPFHIMILGACAIIPLGAAYVLLSAAHLAIYTTVRRLGYSGVLIALATMLMLFTYLLMDGTDPNLFLTLIGVQVPLFSLLSGLIVAMTLVAIVRAIPWRLAATCVVLSYIAFGLLFVVFVPAATDYLVILEGLTYRPDVLASGIAGFAMVPLAGMSLAPILVAPLIDLCFRWSQRNNWSRLKIIVVMALLSTIACIPVTAIDPFAFLEITRGIGTIGTIVSLLLGILGTYIGSWLGMNLGESLQRVESAG